MDSRDSRSNNEPGVIDAHRPGLQPRERAEVFHDVVSPHRRPDGSARRGWRHVLPGHLPGVIDRRRVTRVAVGGQVPYIAGLPPTRGRPYEPMLGARRRRRRADDIAPRVDVGRDAECSSEIRQISESAGRGIRRIRRPKEALSDPLTISIGPGSFRRPDRRR